MLSILTSKGDLEFNWQRVDLLWDCELVIVQSAAALLQWTPSSLVQVSTPDFSTGMVEIVTKKNDVWVKQKLLPFDLDSQPTPICASYWWSTRTTSSLELCLTASLGKRQSGPPPGSVVLLQRQVSGSNWTAAAKFKSTENIFFGYTAVANDDTLSSLAATCQVRTPNVGSSMYRFAS